MRANRILAQIAIATVVGLSACDRAPTALAPADAALSSAARADGGSAEANQVLAEIRRATARYHRVAVAEADGYVQASPCVAHPFLGTMGFHYTNRSLVDAVVDPSAPEVLVYAPDKHGNLKLVAVEFMVVAAPWDATHSGPPTLAGHEFEDHRDPAARHGIPFAHYDLHAWVWRHNPNGMFFPFNPAVSCG